MKYLSLSAFVLLAVLLVSSCEEVPVVVPISDGPSQNSDTIFKTVLIEDLTGVACPNCPKGSAQIKDMIALFGKDQVIAVGVHGRFLASPLPESKYDFRNNHSRAIETSYGAIQGKPASGINRIMFDGEEFLAVAKTDDWPVYAAQELRRPAEATVSLSHTYDAASRQVSATVTVTGITDIDRSTSLSVFFTQSGIIDKQESVGEVIPDYEHNHILIGGMTEPTGDPLSEVGLLAEEVITRTYTYDLPAEDGLWKAEDMEIVAFVHSNSGGTREVYYTTHAKVVE